MILICLDVIEGEWAIGIDDNSIRVGKYVTKGEVKAPMHGSQRYPCMGWHQDPLWVSSGTLARVSHTTYSLVGNLPTYSAYLPMNA